MANTDSFPPHSWLGFGLDMTSVTPLDITSVTTRVLKVSRLIKLSSQSSQQSGNGITWTVPDNVDLATDVNAASSSYSHYKDGTEATNAFHADATLTAKYMAVSGDASMNYSITKSFTSDRQYSMFAFNQNMVEVSFDDWGSSINSAPLKNRMANVKPFDPSNPDPTVIASYQNLFRTLGSHIITGANYGARLQMHIWCTNSNSTVNQDFAADLSVAFSGLTFGGKIDSSVANTDEYKSFFNDVQKTCSCMGGDPALATAISSNTSTDDQVYQTFTKWINTVQGRPGVMSVQIMTLWDLMSASDEPAVSSRSLDVQRAYEWIGANPQEHRTKCRFVINSDWGEIGLLTPSAFIMEDPDSPIDPSVKANLILSSTRITWGKERSHNFQRDVTIDFIIKNDGSPVDIELSHGSDGDTGGSGRCSVSFNDKPYENSGVKGNNWNTQWFYACEVSSNVVL